MPAPGSPRAELRCLLDDQLRTDAQLDAFCLDYFPVIHAQLSGGMSREQKLNLLLQLEPEPGEIQAALARRQQIELRRASLRTPVAPAAAPRRRARVVLLAVIVIAVVLGALGLRSVLSPRSGGTDGRLGSPAAAPPLAPSLPAPAVAVSHGATSNPDLSSAPAALTPPVPAAPSRTPAATIPSSAVHVKVPKAAEPSRQLRSSKPRRPASEPRNPQPQESHVPYTPLPVH